MKRIVFVLLGGILPCLAADITGKWNLTATTAAGREYRLELILKEDAGKLAGTLGNDRGSVPLEEVKLQGDELSFRFDYEGAYRIRMTASGSAMKGEYTAPDGATGKVNATRGGAGTGTGVLGKWKLVARISGGRERKAFLDLREENGVLAGRIETEEGEGAPISDAKFQGGELSFKVVTDSDTFSLVFKVEGDSLRGTLKGAEVQGEITGAR